MKLSIIEGEEEEGVDNNTRGVMNVGVGGWMDITLYAKLFSSLLHTESALKASSAMTKPKMSEFKTSRSTMVKVKG